MQIDEIHALHNDPEPTRDWLLIEPNKLYRPECGATITLKTYGRRQLLCDSRTRPQNLETPRGTQLFNKICALLVPAIEYEEESDLTRVLACADRLRNLLFARTTNFGIPELERTLEIDRFTIRAALKVLVEEDFIWRVSRQGHRAPVVYCVKNKEKM